MRVASGLYTVDSLKLLSDLQVPSWHLNIETGALESETLIKEICAHNISIRFLEKVKKY